MIGELIFLFCKWKKDKFFSCVQRKLAYYGLSVKASQDLLEINPTTIEELFPFPTHTLSLWSYCKGVSIYKELL